jgi:hypothetical protein
MKMAIAPVVLVIGTLVVHGSAAAQFWPMPWSVAQAQANYFNSLAARNYQEAYRLALENRQKMTEIYFYNKALNEQYRAARRSKPLTHEQYVELARKMAPSRLTEKQYDRVLGRLYWPYALQDELFAPERDEVTQLFLNRTPEDYGPTTAFYHEVRRLTGRLEMKLREKLSELSPAEYMAAKNFVLSVGYEAQKPPTEVVP